MLLGALCLCHISCVQYVLVADPIDQHWKWLTRETTALFLFVSSIANNYSIVKASTSTSPTRSWFSTLAWFFIFQESSWPFRDWVGEANGILCKSKSICNYASLMITDEDACRGWKTSHVLLCPWWWWFWEHGHEDTWALCSWQVVMPREKVNDLLLNKCHIR